VDTFLAITRNSIIVLAALTAGTAAFVFLGKWIIDQSEDPDADHH
jgi:hypothetical protein